MLTRTPSHMYSPTVTPPHALTGSMAVFPSLWQPEIGAPAFAPTEAPGPRKEMGDLRLLGLPPQLSPSAHLRGQGASPQYLGGRERALAL